MNKPKKVTVKLSDQELLPAWDTLMPVIRIWRVLGLERRFKHLEGETSADLAKLSDKPFAVTLDIDQARAVVELLGKPSPSLRQNVLSGGAAIRVMEAAKKVGAP